MVISNGVATVTVSRSGGLAAEPEPPRHPGWILVSPDNYQRMSEVVGVSANGPESVLLRMRDGRTFTVVGDLHRVMRELEG